MSTVRSMPFASSFRARLGARHRVATAAPVPVGASRRSGRSGGQARSTGLLDRRFPRRNAKNAASAAHEGPRNSPTNENRPAKTEKMSQHDLQLRDQRQRAPALAGTARARREHSQRKTSNDHRAHAIEADGRPRYRIKSQREGRARRDEEQISQFVRLERRSRRCRRANQCR